VENCHCGVLGFGSTPPSMAGQTSKWRSWTASRSRRASQFEGRYREASGSGRLEETYNFCPKKHPDALVTIVAYCSNSSLRSYWLRRRRCDLGHVFGCSKHCSNVDHREQLDGWYIYQDFLRTHRERNTLPLWVGLRNQERRAGRAAPDETSPQPPTVMTGPKPLRLKVRAYILASR
jgi:hypothetical protein